MCGIAGVISGDGEALLGITRMAQAQRHRGPDDEGFLVANRDGTCCIEYSGLESAEEVDLPLLRQPPREADLALGHRRLSIIDLDLKARGPMAYDRGALWITYNGEVFNYRELREELAAKGHAFRTASDTEVLLAAYREWGLDALHRLNGMWAFGLFDARAQVVICARDRYGVKPLYYHQRADFIAFASEIKGLLAHPEVPRLPREAAMLGFLLDGTLDEGADTFYAGIQAVPPGHLLHIDLRTRTATVRQWYALPEPTLRKGHAEELRALLESAVTLRLRTDVPLGTCLSGGLDSSTLVALTARLASGPHVTRKAFSVLFQEHGIDETRFVDAVVAATRVDSTRTTPDSAALLRDLPRLVHHQDEPFPSTAPFGQWCVMRMAREQGVTVLLDGQGADEVLAGYHYHYGPYLAEVEETHGIAAAWREARAAHKVTGRSMWFFMALLGYHLLPAPRFVRRSLLGRAATQGRLNEGLVDPAVRRRAGFLRSERHRPRLSLLAERRANITRSLPALLRYEDRNSMAFSIEARTPFLDYRLVERALALPASDLMVGGWTKGILREATRGLLPDAVRLRRDKLGFAMPERRWLVEIAPHIRRWLGPEARTSAIVQAKRMAPLLSQSDAALAATPGIWRLISLELWWRTVEAGGPVDLA
jgi:asparagine synthase (glutamine-hydrolysing)